MNNTTNFKLQVALASKYECECQHIPTSAEHSGHMLMCVRCQSIMALKDYHSANEYTTEHRVLDWIAMGIGLLLVVASFGLTNGLLETNDVGKWWVSGFIGMGGLAAWAMGFSSRTNKKDQQ